MKKYNIHLAPAQNLAPHPSDLVCVHTYCVSVSCEAHPILVVQGYVNT